MFDSLEANLRRENLIGMKRFLEARIASLKDQLAGAENQLAETIRRLEPEPMLPCRDMIEVTGDCPLFGKERPHA